MGKQLLSEDMGPFGLRGSRLLEESLLFLFSVTTSENEGVCFCDCSDIIPTFCNRKSGFLKTHLININ